MSTMTVTGRVSVQYYMRKTKSDIIDRITMLHEQLGLGKPDYLKFNHWDKYSLASEAVKLHGMLPEEPPTKTFEVPESVLKELRVMRRKCWQQVMEHRGIANRASSSGNRTAAAMHNRIANENLGRVQALNLFFPESGDTAERDYEQWKQRKEVQS
jgi:hypothetical protein